MQFDFKSVIDALNAQLPFGDNFAFRNARSQVIPSEYLFNTILPQENHVSYNVSGGSMRIYATMAGQLPMDTTPPPIGAIEAATFNEKTTKIGGMMHFPEERLRALQEWAAYNSAQGIQDGLSIGAIQALQSERIVNSLLGFSDILLKSMWDTFEFLRGQALTLGMLDWQYNDLDLTVDYSVPAGNKIDRSGVNSYYNTSSKFWTDIRTLYTKLNRFQIVMNSQTYYSIIDNPENSIEVINSDGQVREFTQIIGTTERRATDVRDRVRVVLYDKSGSVINAAGEVTAVPFLPNGKIIVIGELQPDGFELMTGSTPDPDNNLRLGYTHIAPTVEGGRSGIWERVFTPEGKPFQLLGETVANGMPIITNPRKLMILTTAMPA
jgi:hypothetical protein